MICPTNERWQVVESGLCDLRRIHVRLGNAEVRSSTVSEDGNASLLGTTAPHLHNVEPMVCASRTITSGEYSKEQQQCVVQLSRRELL